MRLIGLLFVVLSFGALASASPKNSEVIVYVAGNADLSEAAYITKKEERGRFIYSRLSQYARITQQRVRTILTKRQISFRPFYIENAILVRGADAQTIKELKALPEVLRIAPNVKAKVKPIEPHPNLKDVPSHLEFINVDKAWRDFNVKGKGLVIAGQDTGYYWEHQALKKQYRGYTDFAVTHNFNWHDAIGKSLEPVDEDGHGTHTMGTMIGDDGRGQQIGVAPDARWIGCRSMNKDGVGSVASYLECFEFFLAPYPLGGNPATDGRPDLAPHIVNNSWSCPVEEGCKADELLGALKALKTAGIFVVSAAGNHGPGCGSLNRAPAIYTQDVVSVGAFNRYTKDVAFYSSLGPSTWNGDVGPQIATAGEVVRSAWIGSPNAYEEKSGTSAASPQVAGVVALLWSKYPQLIGQVDRTREILLKSARPQSTSQSCPGLPGSGVPNAAVGYGILDAHAALSNARVMTF